MPQQLLQQQWFRVSFAVLAIALAILATFWTRDGSVLTDAGGRPIDCDHCPCGSANPCCPGATLADTLWATVTVTDCPAAGPSLSFPIVWDGEKWAGSAAFGTTGRDITILLRCNGSAVGHFESDTSIEDCFGGSPGNTYRPPDVSASCDPFELVWTAHTIGPCDCAGGGNPHVQLTITE